MSTKIYNGYKFKNAPKNLKEVRDIIFKFKEKALKYYRKKYYSFAARDITFIYDNVTIGTDTSYKFIDSFRGNIIEHPFEEFVDSTDSIIFSILDSIDAKAKLFKEQSYKNSDFWEYEFYCNITIFPCKEEVFLVIFTRDSEIEEILGEMDEIEKYPYWNNSDQPDGMTWEEWEERGKEWDEAIGGGVPSKNGFGINIINKTFDIKIFKNRNSDHGPIEEVLTYMPSFEERVNLMVRRSLYIQWEKDHKKEINKLIADKDFYLVPEMFSKFMEENVSTVEKKKEEISLALKHNFTIEDLDISFKTFCEKYNVKEK